MIYKRFCWFCYIFLGIILVLGILRIHSLYWANFTDTGNNRTDKYGYPGNNDLFMNLTIMFVRDAAENFFDDEPTQHPDELQIKKDWEANVTIYYKGEKKGHGEGKNETLSLALEEAVRNALGDKRYPNLSKGELKDARFLVAFSYPPLQSYSFISYNKAGKELIKDMVIIRNLDKGLILKKIEQGKKYLFLVIEKKERGAHKYYHALNDSFENRLHTIYTSSLVLALLKTYDFGKDDQILEYVWNSSAFILSMQNKNKESKGYGAFYYSYNLDNKKREEKFVVGTTAKTIFTLLELYKRSGDFKYLESAELGADWLITMQNPNGSMMSYARHRNGKWLTSKKNSLLYDGQVLSAFSRIYNATKEKKYYNAAEKIAQQLTQKVEEKGCYLGDDYRQKNPISSSWVIMSLLDFYKVNQNEYYKNIIFNCSNELLERQINDPNDILRYGSWQEAYSTSGNGWLNEVMVEVYKFCKEQNRDKCDKYKDAVIKVTRWLIQNTYSEENTFFIKNPERAIGGIFWNNDNKYVRTDSVAHGINAYVGISGDLEEGLLLSIPEKPLSLK